MKNDGFVVNLRLFNKNNNIFLQIICRNTKNVVPLRANNKNTTKRIMKNKPILTEEQQTLATAKEKISEALQEINNELKKHSDMLAERYTNTELFFMEDEEKKEILEKFKPHVIDSAKDEMEDYYEEFEIEI